MIITIGGKSGSGKSSVSKALAAKLGYKRYSAGDIWRQCAAERGMSVLEYNIRAEVETTIDTMADEAQKKLGETEDNIVVESRLGFFFIPKSIKIFLEANDEVRAKRTMEEGRKQENHKSLNEALKKLKARDASDVKRYKKLYKVNPFDPKNYDLVVDTTNNTVEQTADMVYDFVIKKMKKQK
jgi:cytidylate kinase